MTPTLSRKDFVLACMATCSSHTYTPVQLQKLLFLADKVGNELGGPHFDFQPYHYGPFDKAVYQEMEELSAKNEVEIIKDDRLNMTRYRLDAAGEETGQRLLRSLSAPVRDYLGRLSVFVRTASFAELVTAIYEKYPEMRVKSIFRS